MGDAGRSVAIRRPGTGAAVSSLAIVGVLRSGGYIGAAVVLVRAAGVMARQWVKNEVGDVTFVCKAYWPRRALAK